MQKSTFTRLSLAAPPILGLMLAMCFASRRPGPAAAPAAHRIPGRSIPATRGRIAVKQ